MIDAGFIIQAILGTSGVAVLGIVAYYLPTLRRMRADLEKVGVDTDGARITGAVALSSGALEQMNAALEQTREARGEVIAVRKEAARDLQAARDETAQVRREVEALRREGAAAHRDCADRLELMEQELSRYRDVALRHVPWDWSMIQRLAEAGVDRGTIPEAPPLMPQHEQDDDRARGKEGP